MAHESRGGNPRTLAHRAGAILGVTVGVVLFVLGFQALFTANVNDTWWTITTGIAGTLTLLPLSVVGISRPRGAAYGIIASFAVFSLGVVISGLQRPHDTEFSGSNLARFFVYFALPFCSVAALFYYASSKNRFGEPRSGTGSTGDAAPSAPGFQSDETSKTGSVLFR